MAKLLAEPMAPDRKVFIVLAGTFSAMVPVIV